MFAKTTKAVVAALVLTGVSFALTVGAYSAPRYAPSQYAPSQYVPSQAEQAWMNRASNPNTNGY
jgi:hypothetical protein